MLNPSKYVRKAIFDLISDEYECFDMQVTGNKNPTEYVIISTQSKEINKATKCNYRWLSYTLLDIVTIYNGAGNTGSRLRADDIENDIFQLIENINIDGYEVVNRTFEFPDTLDNISTTQNVYRNFIRVILELK
jgi:hypothetical protein